jgi:hypothetical protein
VVVSSACRPLHCVLRKGGDMTCDTSMSCTTTCKGRARHADRQHVVWSLLLIVLPLALFVEREGKQKQNVANLLVGMKSTKSHACHSMSCRCAWRMSNLRNAQKCRRCFPFECMMIKPVSDRRQAWEPREWEDEGGRCSLASRAQHSHLSPMQKRERKKTCKEVYWEVMVGAASCQESCFGESPKRERERERVSQFVVWKKEHWLSTLKCVAIWLHDLDKSLSRWIWKAMFVRLLHAKGLRLLWGDHHSTCCCPCSPLFVSL